jgi:hypothetical protein
MERGITTYLKRNNPVTVTQRLVNYKKIRSLLCLRLVALEASLEAERKKGFFKQNRWRFSKKAKCLIVFAIVAVMLVSFFAFLPRGSQSTPNTPQSSPTASPSATSNQTGSNALSQFAQFFGNLAGSAAQAFSPPKPPGVIESAQTINSTVWMQVAANAWAYFQPGVGVDPDTGLPYAGGTGYTFFTDWDLGVYIQAVIDANKTGLIGTDGAWGYSARLEKVVSFLEHRELNTTTGYPYWFYDATTGKDYNAISDLAAGSADVVDTGRLFVALNNLRNFSSTLALRINNIVLNGTENPNGGSNYAALVPSIKRDSLTSTSIYAYYCWSGFASFWPNDLSNATTTILNNIFSAGNVTTYGVSLPKATILGDPLLCSVFELNNNDTRLMALARQVYSAHEAYYNANGTYVAFSEGNSVSNGFIYEWVVLPNGDTWKITASGSGSYLDINPINFIIYNKVAFSFLALYNTTFARNMVVYLEQNLPDPTNGYSDGADNSGNLVSQVGSNTNGLILDAATYAIQKNP